MHWRPRSWKTHSEIEIARLSDLEYAEPEFAKRLKAAHHESRDLIEEPYAYKISRTGIWVYRRWTEIYKVQGWKIFPAERHTSKKTVES